ncbi:succinate dehydrogenase, cytochrome b556 subunit [Litoribrevibacter euphylliae]|uniref:Succinate dehydrogenase cytochrome b556 subunit n=1 Tax=Litoribrevibacter euphylliae TaxID=1834034 RepID=A0ABV7HDG4_9GAMM
MNSNRPKNLDLTTIQLPLTAKASILHRISGFALFFGMIFVIAALDMSLASEESFNQLKECMQSPVAKFITWGILSALGYHFVAGIKHLLMDAGIGETLESGRIASIITLVLGGTVIILAGVWVW